MKALILAAGRGTRLGLDDSSPKCLASVGGQPLIDRYLDVLDALNVPVFMVVGHSADKIREHVSSRANTPTLITNARYTEGSIVSLSVGLQAMQSRDAEGDLLLLDGDVAFAPSLLKRLCHSEFGNALLVDIGTVFTDEQYMAGLSDGRVVRLCRGSANGHESQGEWVGFAKLSAATVTKFYSAILQQIARGETGGGYEDALAGLLSSSEFRAVPTNGEPWIEIDFADDLARARQLFTTN